MRPGVEGEMVPVHEDLVARDPFLREADAHLIDFSCYVAFGAYIALLHSHVAVPTHLVELEALNVSNVRE